MTELLLVHSPLVGPTTWTATSNALRRSGFSCAVPDLTGLVASDPPYYPKFAGAAADALNGSDPVVLIGHSAAGALIPAIADNVGPTQAWVLVDAVLPHPAQSWFDTAPPPLREQLLSMAKAGRLPPWNEWFPPEVIDELLPDPAVRQQFVAEVPRLAVDYFAEPAPVSGKSDPKRCGYLRFSAGYDHAADEAERLGWSVSRKDWDHLSMLTAPDAVADLIAATIDELGA